MDKHKLLIHLIIVLVVALITIENFDPEFSSESIRNAVVVFFMLLSIIYFNIQVLVPKFLLKNQFWRYLLFLLFGIFFLLVIVIGLIVQPVATESKELQQNNGFTPFTVVILLSTIIQLGFVVAGTTVFMLFQQWTIHNQRISALENATMQSELEQLKNQINPHFLFNMINNANELTKQNPDEAAHVLHKLNDLLKYQLNDTTKDEVLLSADIQFLNDFLNLEKIRRDNFEFTISLEGDLNKTNVPPMLFIPFVENAVKHGNDKESYIHLNFKVENDRLHFTCINSKPKENKRINDQSGGLGLTNIKRRLELLYDQDYSLNISENEIIYTLNLYLKL